jgi:hypothetical protein
VFVYISFQFDGDLGADAVVSSAGFWEKKLDEFDLILDSPVLWCARSLSPPRFARSLPNCSRVFHMFTNVSGI